jgi:surfeit locus 1 family protein
MAPLRTDSGFIVLVNRGYLPASVPDSPAYANAKPPLGEVSLDGLLRLSEPRGGFLRPNRPTQNQWYSRDVAAIAAASGLPAGNVAPYFVDADADAGANERWPQGGLTVIHFANNHLSYLITWYLLALGVAGASLFVARREWQRGNGNAKDR